MPIVDRDGRNYFEHRHVICFQETNVVGNVYFANHVLWQGRCREEFLHEFAPDVIDCISSGLALITIRVSCEYLQELVAFNEVALRMSVGWIRQNRMSLHFDYFRIRRDEEELIARGEQQTAAMVQEDGRLGPCAFPASVLEAIETHALNHHRNDDRGVRPRAGVPA